MVLILHAEQLNHLTPADVFIEREISESIFETQQRQSELFDVIFDHILWSITNM
jgi:hypothetical protein